MSYAYRSRFCLFVLLAVTLCAPSTFAACAWPNAVTARVPALRAYPGGVLGLRFVDVRSFAGLPDVQAMDCNGSANPEVFVHSSPAIFDFRPVCPKRGVRRGVIRFDSPTGTQWTALDPTGVPLGLPKVFPAGVNTVAWYAPTACIGDVILLGTGGVEDGAKDICIRRLCYRCKPKFSTTIPGVTSGDPDPAGAPTWNLEVPVGTQDVEVESQILLDADFEPIDLEDDALLPPGGAAGFTPPPLDPPPGSSVTGWSLAVETAGNFETISATVEGTIAESALTQGFVHVEIVDPDQNGGREGVVCAVALSVDSPVIPDPGGSLVLRIKGRMDASDLMAAGDVAEGAVIRPLGHHDVPLVGSGLPVASAVSTDIDTTEPAAAEGGTIFLLGVEEAGPEFKRGDVTDDGNIDLTDGIQVFKYLFLGTVTIDCLDAGDASADANLDLTDGLLILKWLFLGGRSPEAPFPDCGVNPFADQLGCDSFESCP